MKSPGGGCPAEKWGVSKHTVYRVAVERVLEMDRNLPRSPRGLNKGQGRQGTSGQQAQDAALSGALRDNRG